MLPLQNFIKEFQTKFPKLADLPPWEICDQIHQILMQRISELNYEFIIKDGVAIHKSAVIEDLAVLKAPLIIHANCYISANAYLREGVFLDEGVKIGPGCEIKSSMIFKDSRIAHFNYIGNSIIGSDVNFEAGSIIANHYNERQNKKIPARLDSEIIETNSLKFGALVGDHSRIGANAVLSPGTILNPGSIIKRLELVEQIK
jgi:NDP-sugar pyrophosphorylase family protein